jgi:hypothetical protein
LDPVHVKRVEACAQNVCNVSKKLTKLETRIKVEELGGDIDPHRHIQVKEHLLNGSWFA